MEIKRKEATNCFLLRASCNDESYNPVTVAYIELSRKELMNWLELREKLADLKQNGVNEFRLSAGLYWIEELPDEFTEGNENYDEALSDEERIEVEEIPEDFLCSNEMRMDGSDAILSTWGVGFCGTIKHTSVEASTWSLGWDDIIQALKNCDPQSVRFIKDEEEASGCKEAGEQS